MKLYRFFLNLRDRQMVQFFGEAFAEKALVLGDISFLILLSSAWPSDTFSFLF